MNLKCVREPVNNKGKKVMNFTLGEVYEFTKSYDPEGWEVEDDEGNTEVFFDPYMIFRKTTDPMNQAPDMFFLK